HRTCLLFPARAGLLAHFDFVDKSPARIGSGLDLNLYITPTYVVQVRQGVPPRQGAVTERRVLGRPHRGEVYVVVRDKIVDLLWQEDRGWFVLEPIAADFLDHLFGTEINSERVDFCRSPALPGGIAEIS